jgi:hypothetical protein
MDEREGDSCQDLLSQHGVHKVYCGYKDPTQEPEGKTFHTQCTRNPKIRALCKSFADTFLKDKLDELMAEFESLMGNDEVGGDEEIDIDLDAGEGGDSLEMDDTEEFQSEPMPMEEAVNLQAAPKPVTSEEGGINTKSVNANNSGAAGAAAHPVKMTGDTAQGRSAPGTKELIGKVQNSVGGKKTLSPAPKPVTAQASGVNTKTPFPKA